MFARGDCQSSWFLLKNVYTGAAACDNVGDRLLVGDQMGSVHVWRLVDNEPKLFVVQENILEVQIGYFQIQFPVSHLDY